MKKAIIAIIIAALLAGCSASYEKSESYTQTGSSRIEVSEQSDAAPSQAESDDEVQVDASGGVSSAATSSATQSSDFATLSNKKLCWGQGYNVNDKNQPTSCGQFNNKYSKYGALFIDNKENNICLTFDEGYENGYTAPILDTLKEKEVKAIFFVTYDYCKRNPALVKRMIDEGHTVGNHSWGHYSMPDLTVEKMQSEIKRLHDYVVDNFGYEMTLFRPPMGEFSERSLAVTQSLGYKSVFWSFAYYDYDTKKQPSAASALSKITKAKHSGGIFLLHAISSANAEVLGDVIDAFRADGFTLDLTV